MKPKPRRRFPVPPVFKLLFRGYLIMGFMLAMHHIGAVTSAAFIGFLVMVVSISMVFGVGCLLLMESRPIRASSVSIPETALFFAKGALIMFFVSLLDDFGLVPVHVTSAVILLIAGAMAVAGAASYIYEVMERARPAPRTALRTRRAPSGPRSAARGRSS